MKKIKNCLAKRILCYLLVGCVVSTSFFVSYKNTIVVYADDSNVDNLIRSVVSAIMIVVEVGGAINSGGMSVGYAISALMGLWGDIDNITSYIFDNGDGTYTIDDELIQSVLQAIQDVENSTFDDDDYLRMQNGGIPYNYSGNMVVSQYSNGTGTNILTSYQFSQAEYAPVAACFELYTTGIYTSTAISFRFGVEVNGVNEGRSFDFDCFRTDYYDGSLHSSGTSSADSVSVACSAPKGTYLTDYTGYSYGFNFPVFSTRQEALDYLQYGTGYEKAVNYNQKYFDYSSKYNGAYNGGNFTVSRSALDGLDAKIDEVNNRLDDIDKQIEELQDFLGMGDDNGDDNGGNIDDDVEGSSWLEKIYNILKKIYNKVSSIRRWVIADTIIDGADLIIDFLSSVADFFVDLLKAPASAVGAVADTVMTLNDFLKQKMPFCIPWDIAFLFKLLSAEPKTPEFVIPLKIETYGIDEELRINLEEFEILSKISRTMLTLIFCRGLLNLSTKIITVTVDKKEG